MDIGARWVDIGVAGGCTWGGGGGGGQVGGHKGQVGGHRGGTQGQVGGDSVRWRWRQGSRWVEMGEGGGGSK